MKGYHVTARRHRESIDELGLRTDADGWDARFVWFFLDEAIARAAASNERTWGGGNSGNDIWAIDLDGLDLLPDPHAGWGSSRPGWDDAARALPHHVDRSRLELHSRAEELAA